MDFHLFPAVRTQSIYLPADFRGMPGGAISAVYLRIGETYSTIKTVKYKELKAKMGYLAAGDTTFPHVNGWDTFKTGLTTIVNMPTVSFADADSVGKWLKMTVNTGNFFFNGEQAFVFEISRGVDSNALGSGVNGRGFDWNASNLFAKPRTLIGYRDSFRVANSSQLRTLDLGFDLVTTDIKALTNMASFGLFPNPVTDGRVNISFESRQSVKDVSIIVTDAMGRNVYEQRCAGMGTSFFRELNMGNMAVGTYFLKLTADGETINRRLLVE